MKISREKAKEICTKSQYGEAKWWELLQLNIFLLISKDCARFSMENRKLTSLCENADLVSLSDEDKRTMKAQLNEKSAN
ncbi:hypothetical protein ABV409_14555 [Flagellimonas sp. DF-77]|uniref:hypothetical protein n=1 Tax=Flagellimonas algarum TaxID=3230298 RepID=UPI00339B8298